MSPRTILGYPVTYRTRRYGGSTFVWASVEIDGESHDLGDPWQDARPTAQELQDGVQDLLDLLYPPRREFP